LGKITAIYPRVSSDKQVNNTSLDYQEEVCRNKAKELGEPDELIKVYREEGFSGEDIDRPAMNKLRDDVVNNLVKRIIIVHPDRLSRNMIDRLIVCAEFEKYGVDLIFLDVEYKDTEEGKLFFNIQSSISQYELALIKKRTRRGSIKSSRNGKVMGLRTPPYGYDQQEGKLLINNEEQQFVKRIFEWYVYDKLTIREIGERLCFANAIPKRMKEDINKGKISKDVTITWSASSIHNILKNETYIGKYYYNRRATSKVKGQKTKSGKPKRVYQYRGKDEWIEINVPAIVDVATFMLAQDQRGENTKHSGNIKHEYLLRQKIRCSHCGNKYASYTSNSTTKSKKTGEITSKHSYRNYRCTNKQNRKFGENIEKCSSKIIRADEIEAYIWDEVIMKVLNDTDKVINAIQENANEPNTEIQEIYDLLKFKLDKLKNEKKRIFTLFRKGYIEELEMENEMKPINNDIKSLTSELEKYEKQLNTISKNQLNVEILKLSIEQIKIKLKNNNNLPFKLKREIVDIFIDEILLNWGNDGLKITTTGLIDVMFKPEELSELCTQQETNIDTTNVVFNLISETKFHVDNSGRSVNYEMIKQKLNIG
jgi:site-specific DNA recombinase